MAIWRPAFMLAGLLAAPPPAAAQELGGERPSYTARTLSPAPNAAAMTRRFWSPGLNDGYVPQGLSVIGGAVYVSAYKSDDEKVSRGPCRLFRLDSINGMVTGTLDLPAVCGHAGGLAKGPPGMLLVADTHHLIEVILADTPALGSAGRIMRLTGTVKGSFAAADADSIWLGTYVREGPARLYKVPFKAFKPEIGEADAVLSIALPTRAQGAAFDAKGQLWVTRGGATLGELLLLDPKTGAALATYSLPAGLEDISFDAEGGLWAVSEAGSKRWNTWATFFPVVFRFDVARLR